MRYLSVAHVTRLLSLEYGLSKMYLFFPQRFEPLTEVNSACEIAFTLYSSRVEPLLQRNRDPGKTPRYYEMEHNFPSKPKEFFKSDGPLVDPDSIQSQLSKR